MKRFAVQVAAAVLALVACTTEPCACPPARTGFIVYGQVRTVFGATVSHATVQFLLAPPTNQPTAQPCLIDPATSDADPSGDHTDAAGQFHTFIYSLYAPATRCLRVIVLAPSSAGGTDTARVEDLLVPFRFSQTDSIGLVFTLR